MKDKWNRDITVAHDARGWVYSRTGCEVILPTQDDAKAAELLGMVNAPNTAVVPQSVTRRQAKQALFLAGLLSSVQPAINAIADATQRALIQIEWDESLSFERNRPALIALATALGLSSSDLDQLFITAAGL